MYTIYLLCFYCRVGSWITLTGRARQVGAWGSTLVCGANFCKLFPCFAFCKIKFNFRCTFVDIVALHRQVTVRLMRQYK